MPVEPHRKVRPGRLRNEPLVDRKIEQRAVDTRLGVQPSKKIRYGCGYEFDHIACRRQWYRRRRSWCPADTSNRATVLSGTETSV